MIAGYDAVKKYIPQRDPMIMIDRIGEVTNDSSAAGLKVTEQNIFIENGRLNEAGLVEHIAQSAAAGLGVRCEQQGIPVPLGFIAAIKNLKISELPVVGSTLETNIQITNTIFEVSIINGRTFCEGQLMAACEMRIFTQ